MQEENNIREFDRLDAVARKYFGSLKSLAEKLHISSQAIYQWKNGIPFKQYQSLSDIGINPDYIRTGEGEMLLETRKAIPGHTPIITIDPKSIKELDLKYLNYYQAQEIKQAMIDKIQEIDNFYAK